MPVVPEKRARDLAGALPIAVELGAGLWSSDDVVKALNWPGLIIQDLLYTALPSA
jgi:hypothetical protein